MTPSKPEQQGWEEEFDKKFGLSAEQMGIDWKWMREPLLIEDVKAFIRQLLEERNDKDYDQKCRMEEGK